MVISLLFVDRGINVSGFIKVDGPSPSNASIPLLVVLLDDLFECADGLDFFFERSLELIEVGVFVGVSGRGLAAGFIELA